MTIEKMDKKTYRKMMSELLDQIELYESTQNPDKYDESVFTLDAIKLLARSIVKGKNLPELNKNDFFEDTAFMLSSLDYKDSDILCQAFIKTDDRFKQIVTRAKDLSRVYLKSMNKDMLNFESWR
jgi:hypothetical protein